MLNSGEIDASAEYINGNCRKVAILPQTASCSFMFRGEQNIAKIFQILYTIRNSVGLI
jgi:hypothetical protein